MPLFVHVPFRLPDWRRQQQDRKPKIVRRSFRASRPCRRVDTECTTRRFRSGFESQKACHSMAKVSAPRKPRQSAKAGATGAGKAAAGASVRSGRIRRFFRPLPLLIAAGIGLVWVCLPLLLRQLPSLNDRPEYQVSPELVTINTPPRWIPPDLVQQVFTRANLGKAESLLDDTLSERVAAAFYTHPWISDVIAVRKSFPARLYVEVRYREPVAMVKAVDGFYPVDREGILLPPSDFTIADTERFPVIEGVSSAPVGYLGEEWGDPAVSGAAQLAALLKSKSDSSDTWWNRFGLQAIVVPRRVAMAADADNLEFQLKTAGGTRILWGRPPNSVHPGELSVAQKLQRLCEYQRDYKGFDDAHGPYELDIRPWHGIGRSMLAKDAKTTTSVN